MSFLVRVKGSEITFDCAAGESILDAAERAGLVVPYSCRKGVCTTCEGALLGGEVELRGRRLVGAVDAVLMCQARPRTDV